MVMNFSSIHPYCDHFVEMEYFYKKLLSKATTLPEEFSFLEIGTRAGGTALLALNAIKESGKINRFLFTVDPYGAMPCKRPGDFYGEKFRITAMKCITDFCYYNNLNHTHFRMTSFQFFNTWTNNDFWFNGKLIPKSFAFIYFDGDHSDEIVFKELSLYVPLVCLNGLYAVDDQYDERHYSHIVKEKPFKSSNRLFFDLQAGDKK